MQLTLAQRQTLKAHIVANYGSAFEQSTVNALNAIFSPDYFIFKKTIDLYTVMSNGYDWTVVDNESVGQARIWDRMLGLSRQTGGVSPWKTTILQGVGEAYKGNTPATVAPHRRNILRNHFPRPCRIWEKLFVAAAPDWNVGSNGDKTGNRGTNTNPDIMQLDALGEYLDGDISLEVVIDSESAPNP